MSKISKWESFRQQSSAMFCCWRPSATTSGGQRGQTILIEEKLEPTLKSLPPTKHPFSCSPLLHHFSLASRLDVCLIRSACSDTMLSGRKAETCSGCLRGENKYKLEDCLLIRPGTKYKEIFAQRRWMTMSSNQF